MKNPVLYLRYKKQTDLNLDFGFCGIKSSETEKNGHFQYGF